ncbi:galactitol-1-phosphate 5-dehydrogenase [Devosia sp.]|uniref:galactitol-1-phosphate 5-dehydrogenase n=1 Tax=Devosia sp. TaxID=1871048 RepID=UPI0027344615|nr:galactitol-1-phosphate 5-dehydrogenase [Devosia sp.]MDP2779723.1 galactitol-1-phosphate 5-dehydrogenase [Devosia sp.]
MRAAVLHKPKDIRLETVADPISKANHVIVHVEAVGVCGSDLPRMLIKGAHKMPLICGHEFCGKITEIGEGVKGYSVGELVAIPPMLPCMECDQCAIGNFSRCRNYDYFGSRRDGAYAEFVSVPVSNLLKTPAGIDPRAVAMVDPASIALHAIWKAGGVSIGQRGGTIGCGPIGLFAIQWLKLMGASDVVAVDVSKRKLELAKQAGATHTFLAGEEIPAELRCDVIIEAAGHPSSVNAAVNMAAPAGHVVFIGIPVGDINLANKTFQHFLRQEVSLHGSWNSFGAPFPGPQWTVTLDKLGSGELKWEFMISHDLGLEELPNMFEKLATDRGMFFSKIMFRP